MQVLVQLMLAVYHLWSWLNDKYLAMSVLWKIVPQWLPNSKCTCASEALFLVLSALLLSQRVPWLATRLFYVKRETLAEYKYFFSCSASSQRFSVMMKRWKPTLLPSSLPTVISFVWPRLNKKSKQMHVKDPFLTSSLLFCLFSVMFIKK